MKKFNLLVWLYNGLNRLDERFFRKEHPDYCSNFSLHVLVMTLLGLLSVALMALVVRLTHRIPGQTSISFVLMMTNMLFLGYWLYFLSKRLPLLGSVGRKIGYLAFTFVFLVLIGPVLFPLVLAVILLLLALQIALWLLAVVVWVIDLFNGGSGGGRGKRWRLDNGDEVKERSGLFGDKTYTGRSGRSYETHDGGETFREK